MLAGVVKSFRLIGDRAQAHLSMPDDSSSAAGADSIVAVLRSDYERWTRWLVGIIAYMIAVIGILFSVALMAFLVQSEGPALERMVGVVTVVIALGMTIGGAWVLAKLWLSGRRMLRTAVAWMRLPYTRGVRARTASGWLSARTTNLEPRIFARILTSSLSLLVAISGIAVFIRDVVTGEIAGDMGYLAVAMLLIGLVSLAAGLAQLGGVMRLVSGVAEGDPLWVFLRGKNRT